MVNQTRAIDKTRLIKKLGQISSQITVKVDEALKLHYDLE